MGSWVVIFSSFIEQILSDFCKFGFVGKVNDGSKSVVLFMTPNKMIDGHHIGFLVKDGTYSKRIAIIKKT